MPFCEPGTRENMTRIGKVADRFEGYMCCGESFNVPIPAKETPSQEVCPTLSSEAVCLGRSPTPTWNLVTSRLCGCEHVLYPIGSPQGLW